MTAAIQDPEPLGATFAKSPCAKVEQTSTASVSIHFTSEKCSYTAKEARAGILIEYAIVIEEELPGVFAQRLDRTPLGQSEQLNEQGTGARQYYVVPTGRLDSGRAVPKVGVYRRSVRWDGMTFSGPPNTKTPKLGKYELMIRSELYSEANPGMEERPAHEISGLFDFEITP
jgi:hypothetical protein